MITNKKKKQLKILPLFSGVLYDRVSSCEWCVLGTDGHGSHEPAAKDEQVRGHGVHQDLPTPNSGGIRSDFTPRPPPALHTLGNTGVCHSMCVCMCVCERERERERESFKINLSLYKYVQYLYHWHSEVKSSPFLKLFQSVFQTLITFQSLSFLSHFDCAILLSIPPGLNSLRQCVRD